MAWKNIVQYVYKLRKKGNGYMKQIIEALNNLRDRNVNIYTNHRLYGKQHIKIKFEPETKNGLGFRCREQIIYINAGDVVSYYIQDNKIIINGKMMSITITDTL